MRKESLNSKLVALGVSKSYASELAAGTKTPGEKLAIKIYRKLGLKLGPIANASAREIKLLEKLVERRSEAAA